jgi:hypothetical protein
MDMRILMPLVEQIARQDRLPTRRTWIARVVPGAFAPSAFVAGYLGFAGSVVVAPGTAGDVASLASQYK